MLGRRRERRRGWLRARVVFPRNERRLSDGFMVRWGWLLMDSIRECRPIDTLDAADRPFTDVRIFRECRNFASQSVRLPKPHHESAENLLLLASLLAPVRHAPGNPSCSSPARKATAPGQHEHPAGCELLAKHLKTSGLAIKAEVSLGWPQDAAKVAAADTIVIYSDGQDAHVAKAACRGTRASATPPARASSSCTTRSNRPMRRWPHFSTKPSAAISRWIGRSIRSGR